jgi:hypothetical protein
LATAALAAGPEGLKHLEEFLWPGQRPRAPRKRA